MKPAHSIRGRAFLGEWSRRDLPSILMPSDAAAVQIRVAYGDRSSRGP